MPRGKHSGHARGASNPMWKGGRSIASNGYVLLRMPGHHLADVRGYVYEHRLVAEQKLGRCLRKGEIPHHINGVKSDNRPENIDVVESEFAHRVRYRRKPSDLQNPHEPNEFVVCGCGCGEMFAKFDASGRLRVYVTGHNPKPTPESEAVLRVLASGPRSRTAIAGIVGKPVNVVAQTLSKLRAKGAVRPCPLGRGVWERAS